MTRRPILLALGIAALANAQDAPGTVIRIDVNLVQIDAVVTDAKGRHVPNLTIDDFEILQDGKQQAISKLSYITAALATSAPKNASAPSPPAVFKRADVRRTFAMVVDDLGLSFESMVHVREALKKFVDQQMQPGDLVAIMRTSAGMGAFQQFTADKVLLHAAIDRIRFSLFSRVGVFSFAPIGGTGGNLNPSGMDDVSRAGTFGALRYAVDGLGQLPGRKALVLFSESMLLPTLPDIHDSMRHLIDAANRSSVVFYTIDPRGLQPFSPGAADRLVPSRGRSSVAAVIEGRERQVFRSEAGLSALAEETGGLFIHDDNYLDDAIRQAVDDSAGYYLIAYRPKEATFDSFLPKFHRVQVLVGKPGLRIRTRSGFFGVADSVRAALPVTPEEQLRQALTSPFAAGAIHVRLTTLFTNTAAQGSSLDALLHIDARDLRFTDLPDGSRQARLDVLATIFGNNGGVEETAGRSWEVQAAPADFEKVLDEGLLCTIHHPIHKPGAYQMRVAVRDAASEQLGSASQFLQVPDLGSGRLALSSLMLPHVGGNAAVRIFPPGATLKYEYRIFNAKADADGHPEIQVRTRMFRDGAETYASQPMPLGRADLSDPARIVAGGEFQLSDRIVPGDYVFQLIVTNKLARGKSQTASQWIDFEIAPNRQP